MEVAETFAHRSEQFIPFGLSRAANHELYCGSTRTKGHILEIIYSHHCDERLFMEQSTLSELSTFIPSNSVPKNSKNIFNNATKDEKHHLLVNWNVMSEELRVGGERATLTDARWSPEIQTLPTKYYLAYLTNFGMYFEKDENMYVQSMSIMCFYIFLMDFYRWM